MEHTVNKIEWITLADGTRLAATIWMPERPGPFPAVLEFLPYRRGDGTARRDDATYPSFATAGIVGVRVDSRGMGDSEGQFDDEYSPQELSDICEVIAWIAERTWSNGNVGMMGISWGGFNGLQVAAMRPPALKAVISIASTADRYNDDIHYKGGCLLSANIYWAGTMLSYASRPPDPDIVGNRWAQIWRDRLEQLPLLLETWLTHQHRDDYWRHGSICEDWNAIQCPVWVIAGWADGYRNTPATLARNAAAPVKATTGPWVHQYPHFALPHPRIDFLSRAADWWHHWLSDTDHGVDAWPDHAVYVIDGARPDRWREREPGSWVSGQAVASTSLVLGADGNLNSSLEGDVVVETPQHLGTTAGEYFTLAPDAQMPSDQRLDDAMSVCWETEISDGPTDIVGRPSLNLEVAINQTQGNLVARLVDVHPDGTATLVSRGVLNLCHRSGNENPTAMVPGRIESVTIMLDETAYRVPAGHRLRLALSTTYWPLILPSPARVCATIKAGTNSALHLPIAVDMPAADLSEPVDPTPLPSFPIKEPGHGHRDVTHDLMTGRVRYRISESSGLSETPRTAMESKDTRDETWEIDPNDPNTCTGELEFTSLRRRGDWQAKTVSRIRFTAQSDSWHVIASLNAWHGDEHFKRRNWSFSVPRKLV